MHAPVGRNRGEIYTLQDYSASYFSWAVWAPKSMQQWEL